jgi:hypothetical protein
MADFVAVIRRAVDGLATNTPEARTKVYEKARGAVQRQLENMKPRPSDDMLRRQMDKLQAAISEVEAEHQEALAPLDEPFAAAPVEEPVAVVPPPVPDVQSRAVDEPSQEAAAEPAYEPAPAPVPTPEPAAPAPVPPPVPAYEDRSRYFQDEGESEAVAPEVRDAATPATQTFAAEQPPAYQELPPEVHADIDSPPISPPGSAPDSGWSEEAVAEPARNVVNDEWRTRETASVFDHEVEPRPERPPATEPAFVQEPEDDFPYPSRDEQRAAEPATYEPPQSERQWAPAPVPPEPLPTPQEWTWNEPVHSAAEPAPAVDEPVVPAYEPAAPGHEPGVVAAWDIVPELVPVGPVEPIERGPSAEGIDAHFDQETHVSADVVRMPAVSDLPELPPAPAAGDMPDDPFADYPVPVQPAKAGPKEVDRDPWSDLEDLIGYHNQDTSGAAVARSSAHDDDIDDLMSPPTKPYRVTQVRKRNYAGIILGIVGLAVVGGGAYAMWINRASLNDVVDGLFQSGLNGEQSAQQTPPAQSGNPPAASSSPTAGQTTSGQPAPAQTPQTPAQPPATPNAASATPGASDGSASSSKFTQRLMPDGSEINDGPGATGGLAQNAEGQSVAQLNAPPANPPSAAAGASSAPTAPGAPVPTTPAPATPGAPGASTTQTPAPAAAPTDTPAVSGEKMFLYEERIGQTAPTAIDGSVSWSLQREPGADGKPPEPVVQGRITIPGRGMTALMTFKRNSDPSLPASHLIEIVFAVPPDFEGGAIDSVQRIAMKQSEQDRGNALIAVPAKITDDFHMIALNDFPDARATNLDLLRTRNWIDIPVAYRNGRRALLTLQKGPEGEKAFNDAIREWGQLGGTTTGQ